MKDFKIDFNNNKMLNEFVDKKERVVQQIIVACRSWLGDFFLNDEFGVDYDNSWGDTGLMRAFVKEQILAIDGVDRINSIDIKRTKTPDERVAFVIDAEIVYTNKVLNIYDLLIYQ